MNSSKSILIIVDDYLPNSTKVAAKMMHDLAKGFHCRGDNVTVLTPKPSLKCSYKKEYIDNIEVIFFKSGEIKNVKKIKRAINESLLSYHAWKKCKRILKERRFDGIIYYSPSIFWGKLIKKLKKLYGVKSYLILRDIFPQWVVDNGLVKENSLIYKYFHFFEKINYQSADCIGVMSKANLEWFQKKFKNLYEMEVLHNWTNIISISHRLPGNNYRRQLKLENRVVFFYGGNIGHAQNMRVLVELANRMKEIPEAHFLFVGKGDEVDLILQKKKDFKLDNVTYLKPVKQTVYFRMLSEFDVGLFNLHPKHTTHNFPGKLLGYMQYKKPIIGCVNAGNDLREIINNANAGRIFENEDVESLYNIAMELTKSKVLREEFGSNARELLRERFDVQETVNQLRLFFNN